MTVLERLRRALRRPPKLKVAEYRRPCPNARCARCGGRYGNHPEAREGRP